MATMKVPKQVNSPPEVGQSAPEFEDLLGADGQRYSMASFDHMPILALSSREMPARGHGMGRGADQAAG